MMSVEIDAILAKVGSERFWIPRVILNLKMDSI
jgi:hypothetical protein